MDERAAATLLGRRVRRQPSPGPHLRRRLARRLRPGAGHGRRQPARRRWRGPSGSRCSATSIPTNRVATYPTRTTVALRASRRCCAWSSGPARDSSPPSHGAGRQPRARPRRPMTRLPLIAKRVEQLLGSSVIATAPVAGGDICTTTRVRLCDGTTALVKTRPQAPEGFFDAEARGLRWLAEARPTAASPCPRCSPPTTTAWSSAGSSRARTPIDAAVLGQSLARTHRAGAGPSAPTTTATSAGCRCPTDRRRPGRSSTSTRRIAPYLKLARDRGASRPRTTRPRSRACCAGWPSSSPDEPPARLHGDLWNGNVLWGARRRVPA